jgi:hypothetical protein
MKRYSAIFFFLFLMFSLDAIGQSLYRFRFEDPWSVAIHAGPTQYFGELYSLWKYDEGIQPDFNIGLTGRYTFGTNLKARMDLSFYQISGQDVLADPVSMRIPRNLNFRARNFEAAMLIEYYYKPVKLYNHSRHFLNPYIFAGIGLSSNNPYGNYRGQWVALRPLQTEGEAYPGIIVTFPMGVGVKYKLNPWVDLTLEANYRFTNTDYLDDISSYNVSEFYEDLIADYNMPIEEGGNPMRLRMAIRNPNFMRSDGEPDVDAIVRNGGRIRRGSGLDVRKDGFMSFNLGMEIYFAHDIWDNWIFRRSPKRRSYRYW